MASIADVLRHLVKHAPDLFNRQDFLDAIDTAGEIFHADHNPTPAKAEAAAAEQATAEAPATPPAPAAAPAAPAAPEQQGQQGS